MKKNKEDPFSNSTDYHVRDAPLSQLILNIYCNVYNVF